MLNSTTESSFSLLFSRSSSSYNKKHRVRGADAQGAPIPEEGDAPGQGLPRLTHHLSLLHRAREAVQEEAVLAGRGVQVVLDQLHHHLVTHLRNGDGHALISHTEPLYACQIFLLLLLFILNSHSRSHRQPQQHRARPQQGESCTSDMPRSGKCCWGWASTWLMRHLTWLMGHFVPHSGRQPYNKLPNVFFF